MGEARQTGIVKKVFADKQFGFIATPDRGDCFFHELDVQGEMPSSGDAVSFVVTASARGLRAARIRRETPGDQLRQCGRVARFFPSKGYGFVRQPGLDRDLRVHISDVEDGQPLVVGTLVSYVLAYEPDGRPRPVSVRLEPESGGDRA
jgi:cold shock CspA family protein